MSKKVQLSIHINDARGQRSTQNLSDEVLVDILDAGYVQRADLAEGKPLPDAKGSPIEWGEIVTTGLTVTVPALLTYLGTKVAHDKVKIDISLKGDEKKFTIEAGKDSAEALLARLQAQIEAKQPETEQEER